MSTPTLPIAETQPPTGQAGADCVQRFVGRLSVATLYHADCMSLLPLSADAVITDPPYGISLNTNYKEIRPSANSVKRKNLHLYSKQYEPVKGDDAPFDPTPWLAYTTVVLWGCNNYLDKLKPGSLLYWDKRADNGHALKSEGEAGWMNHGRMVYYFDHCWHGFARASENSEHHHPTQKPVALMIWAMEKAKLPVGVTVLDPYMGSGTMGIACLRTGRNFIGVEKDKRHFDTACERIRNELKQGVML